MKNNLFRRLWFDRRGNVMMLLGFAMIPLIFTVGMGVDYSRAMRTETKLNAAADAAALSAVTTPMMNQSATAACAIARKMFVAQAAGLEGLQLNTNDPAQLSISITQSNGVATDCTNAQNAGAVSLLRVVTVTYTGQSTNDFGGILGVNSLTVHGTSASSAAVAPNIDFYMMIDTSPSMLLPATSGGLTTMVANTQGQMDTYGYRGCAFACHQTGTTPSQDANMFCNPVIAGQPAPSGAATINVKDCASGSPIKTNDNRARIDNYQLARNLGIKLRTDLVSTAIQDLTNVATSTASLNHATYRMGLADFDIIYRQLWPTTPAAGGAYVDASLPTVSTHVADAQILTYCTNNNQVCGTNDNDQGTNYTAALTGANTTMPTPGSGAATDKPQEVLFIITDGMRDENSGGRQIGPLPTAKCDTIKNRGIRIAILYTEYLPDSASDHWSITTVKTPYLSPTDKISPPLISCASPGLYYKVTTDSDISGALAALFQTAVATARLTQ